MKTITKRNGNIVWDKQDKYFGSLRVTLTGELQDIGIDTDKNLDDVISISVVEDNNKKRIIIEKVVSNEEKT
jgi:5-enolpyruvylshikimate-3-phosphate synthase